jgi:hypothetical protein
MITLRVWFVMISMAIVLAGASVWTAIRPAAAISLSPPSPTVLQLLDQSADDTADEPRTDVFGNEIQDAVGDYRVDRRGDVYEGHSPDTAVTRLGPPVG